MMEHVILHNISCACDEIWNPTSTAYFSI